MDRQDGYEIGNCSTCHRYRWMRLDIPTLECDCKWYKEYIKNQHAEYESALKAKSTGGD